MDADKRTAKKRYVGVVWSVWHGPEQREWYGYHLWDICKMTLQHDFRTLQALDFSWLIDDWRLTPSALLNRMGIWVVLHDVLRCNRTLKILSTEAKFPTVLKVSSEIFGIDSNLSVGQCLLFPQGPPETRFFEAVVSYNDLWLLPALPSM